MSFATDRVFSKMTASRLFYSWVLDFFWSVEEAIKMVEAVNPMAAKEQTTAMGPAETTASHPNPAIPAILTAMVIFF